MCSNVVSSLSCFLDLHSSHMHKFVLCPFVCEGDIAPAQARLPKPMNSRWSVDL